MKIRAWFSRHMVMLLVVVACLFFGPINNVLAYVHDSRMYRDYTLVTPFHKVVLGHSELADDGNKIVLTGTMIKRRCWFTSQSAYLYDDHGVGHFTSIDTTAEDVARKTTGNRPPSLKPQAWGPWTLTNYTGTTIVSYEIWARHLCPESPIPQENLFISGSWK